MRGPQKAKVGASAARRAGQRAGQGAGTHPPIEVGAKRKGPPAQPQPQAQAPPQAQARLVVAPPQRPQFEGEGGGDWLSPWVVGLAQKQPDFERQSFTLVGVEAGRRPDGHIRREGRRNLHK